MTDKYEHDELTDLGQASVETRGSAFGRDDTVGGLIPLMGLSEE